MHMASCLCFCVSVSLCLCLCLSRGQKEHHFGKCRNTISASVSYCIFFFWKYPGLFASTDLNMGPCGFVCVFVVV